MPKSDTYKCSLALSTIVAAFVPLLLFPDRAYAHLLPVGVYPVWCAIGPIAFLCAIPIGIIMLVTCSRGLQFSRSYAPRGNADRTLRVSNGRHESRIGGFHNPTRLLDMEGQAGGFSKKS